MSGLHPESAHDLLAPHDLVHHLPDHHHTFPAEILARITHPQQVTDALEELGIPSTTPEDAFGDLEPWQCDALVVWHEQAHADPAASHRIGVTDPAGGATLWYELESAETTYLAWRLLRDYGRDGIEVTVQLRGTDGAWRTVNPPLVTRPHDWQGDTDT